MNSLDELETTILAEARSFIEPNAADESRVFSGLSDYLGLGGTATVSRIESANRGLATRLRHFAATRKAVALSCLLVGAGAGFYAGRQSSRVELARNSVISRPQLESHAAAVGESPAAAPGSAEVTVKPQQLVSSKLLARSPAPTSRTRSTATTVNLGGSDVTTADPIGEEVSLLRRAEQAIRSREPQLALGLIQELDRRFPHGKLLEERSAARVMANCLELEPEAARRAGEAYLRITPSHVYQERIRQLCGLGEGAPNVKSDIVEKASAASGD